LEAQSAVSTLELNDEKPVVGRDSIWLHFEMLPFPVDVHSVGECLKKRLITEASNVSGTGAPINMQDSSCVCSWNCDASEYV